MGKPLDDYRKKRDFERTPEPAPQPVEERAGDVFVVHRHDASRLHYDLRIELNGALCSWAVPKGFSYDPDDKHLAVRTEDHPLEYENFHGVIPKGQYGAGTMTIWDRGRYEFVRVDGVDDPLAAGEVKLVLRGRRLRGEWHLVRTKQGPNTWLLFKKRDRYAGSKRDSAATFSIGSSALLVTASGSSVGGSTTGESPGIGKTVRPSRRRPPLWRSSHSRPRASAESRCCASGPRP